jgi:hypothetical protein
MPTKDDMVGGPADLTLLHFLDGSWLVSVRRIRSFDWSEDFVQGVEEHSTEALASLARAFYTTGIVVHMYVELSGRVAA